MGMKNLARNLIIKNKGSYLLASNTKRFIRNLVKLKPKQWLDLNRIKKQYKANADEIRKIKRQPATEISVVVHLYYTEGWDVLKTALQNISKPFDVFITLPKESIGFSEEILKDYSNAYILEVPNRGRDVLPFLQIAQELKTLGYKYVLKVHSKKSPHRKDGDKWFRQLVASLLPSKPETFNKLMGTLADEDTGIIGPVGQYISLTVNFPANGPRIAEALSNIYYPALTDKVIRTRRQYGFFAGTMFWARLDAIRPILDRKFKVSRFDPEKGQIDATFAHALERVFSLVPEIESKKMYEIGPRSIKQLEYKTDNVPDWSDVYIGPKPVRKPRKRNN
jgi:lipopolysaccharide biosynthesis protein